MRTVAACVFLLAATSVVADDLKPSIVLVMADDLGYGDLGCYHSDNPLWPDAPPPTTQTPQLDRLAAAGTLFLDFHSNGPVCSPTRAALLTGRYQQRSGIGGVIYADPKQNRHHGLHASEYTIAEAVKTAGYATAVFGKWHLGYDVAFNPLEHGFGRFRGYVSGNVDYVAHLDRMGIPDWYDGRFIMPERGYTTHLITQHAVDFIKSTDGPSFTYVAHECPHDPIQAPGDPPVRRSGHVGNTSTPRGDDRDDRRRRMIGAMDDGIGELMRAVESAGRDAVFVFCSDNGAVPFGDNGPWRGNKGQVLEGGHRVPMIVARYDGRSRSWRPLDGETKQSSQTLLSMDIMPTICDLVGADAGATDGISFATVADETATTRPLVWAYRDEVAVREGDWKLHIDRKERAALYNLADNRGETTNIAKQHPEIVKRLTAFLRTWAADVESTATKQPE